MTSMGLRAGPLPRHQSLNINVPQPQLDGTEPAFVHPPVILQPKPAEPKQQGNIIRDLLQRLRQQPTPADEPAPEPQKEKPMQSVLRK